MNAWYQRLLDRGNGSVGVTTLDGTAELVWTLNRFYTDDVSWIMSSTGGWRALPESRLCSRHMATCLESSYRESGGDAEGCRSPEGRRAVATAWELERAEVAERDDLVQIMLVAGARNRHYLQLWRLAA